MTEPALPEPSESRPDLDPAEVPAEPAPDAAHPVCDLCGTEMFEWHCRIVCPSCGYQRDCSDP